MLSGSVRIQFTKVGSLQFISHLDLNRTMKTVMIRAGIPIKYSEGFNPHPKMVFSLPLSIGTESVSEFMDFKLNTPMKREELIECLNNALPPEMRVLDAYVPTRKLTEIGYAAYRLESEKPFSLKPLDAESIVVMKRSKSGEKPCDIKPMILDYAVEGRVLTCKLSASPESYLNPEYIAKLLDIPDCTIVRVGVYLKDGKTPFK